MDHTAKRKRSDDPSDEENHDRPSRHPMHNQAGGIGPAQGEAPGYNFVQAVTQQFPSSTGPFMPTFVPHATTPQYQQHAGSLVSEFWSVVGATTLQYSPYTASSVQYQASTGLTQLQPYAASTSLPQLPYVAPEQPVITLNDEPVPPPLPSNLQTVQPPLPSYPEKPRPPLPTCPEPPSLPAHDVPAPPPPQPPYMAPPPQLPYPLYDKSVPPPPLPPPLLPALPPPLLPYVEVFWTQISGQLLAEPQPGPSTQVEAVVGHHVQITQGYRAIGVGRRTSAIGSVAWTDTLQKNLVTRPADLVTKQGTTGTALRLTTNYFQVLSMTDWRIHKYRVNFFPSDDRTAVKKHLLRPHRLVIGPYIFDGVVLYTSIDLRKELILFSNREPDGCQIRIELKKIGYMEKGDNHYLQFFNIIMRKCLEHLKLQLVGRGYYDALRKIELKDVRLELWPGYSTSIRQYERDVFMCTEIIHKVMRQQTLYDILAECASNNINEYQKNFSLAVIGQIVLTGYNNNTYRIDDVDYSSTPQSTFSLHNGQTMSYLDYYKNKYQIVIHHPTQPLLVSRVKPRERRAGKGELVYLVPELCRSTGITREMRDTWNVMKTLGSHTRLYPENRIKKLLEFNQRLRSERNIVKELTDWNLKLNDKLLEIDGRQLPSEKIIFAREQKIDAGPEAVWTKELGNMNMLSCGKLETWVVIAPMGVRNALEKFITMLMKVAGQLGFLISHPHVHELVDDRSQSYVHALEAILSKVSVKLIFCVVPNNRADRYAAIKKKCCVDRPVPSQIFIAKNLTNKLLSSIVTKVAVQLNCKIGGAPWAVEIPLTGLMIVGFDVSHDTASRGRDYGALVVSLDKSCSQYFSVVSAHSNGEELSNDLSINMCKALYAYRERNKALPQRIVFYRDGVGDGQIPYVYEHEVKQLRSRLAQVYGGKEAKMAFILITKRISTRLFFNNGNPPPGTVVDDVITSPNKYDFFIVPQSVRAGTVTPTAFNVISDNAGLNADKLQRLTYKLTHIYYNWSGTVRVPAPCQYAHKLAFLVGQYLHRMPDAALQNVLFFL